MNTLLDEKVVKRLRGLADGSIHATLAYYGICAELEELVEFEPGRLSPYFKSWEHYSGDPVYPVHDPENKGSPKQQYNDPPDLWHGRYGELRKDLCTHVANEIEKEL